jgi:hypothetical protein
MADPMSTVKTRARDGSDWRIGTGDDCEWITRNTKIGFTVTAAIPPIFDAYATVVVPVDAGERAEHEQALLRLLMQHSVGPPWWLGYLGTGSEDVVFADAPMVTMYARWPYVLVEAGPEQAASWRDGGWSSLRGALPDVMFPNDRSWLVSRLWDDDWRCLGGTADLIAAVIAEPSLEARSVGLDQDATPPGHQAF